MSSHPSESVTLRPDPRSWPLTAAAYAVEQSARDHDRRVRLREQLGLPAEGLVIMAGHQAEIWHPGILAKWFAMHAQVRVLRARGLQATPAWIVVDQDAGAPWKIKFPTRRDGELRAALWDAGADAGFDQDSEVPTGMRPPLKPAAADFTSSPVAPELERLRQLLSETASAPNLAAQMTRVLERCLADWTPPATIIRATDLSRTSLMGGLVKWMGAEPTACVLAYNAAAITEPAADVRPLLIDERTQRVELPLWRVRPGQARARVFAHELASIDPAELAPRALFMTALVRMGACDQFIHGLGGEKYEQVTDRWLASWLATEKPAPVVVASATCFIPGLAGSAAPPTPQDIDHAVWLASSARNNPALINDQAAADQKAALVQAVRAAPDPVSRLAAFHKMRDQVRETIAARAGELAALEAEATRLRSHAAQAAVVYERGWPFAIYPRDVIARLKRDVDAALG